MPSVPDAFLRHKYRAKIAAQSVMLKCPIYTSEWDSKGKQDEGLYG